MDALPIHYDLAVVDVFFNLGPRALEMPQAPRYLNPALEIAMLFCKADSYASLLHL